MTVSLALTASAKVRMTVLVLTETGLAAARLTASPFTFTTKELASGTDLVFQSTCTSSLKARVSVAPFTVALMSAIRGAPGLIAGVSFMTSSPEKASATLPAMSRAGPSLGGA